MAAVLVVEDRPIDRKLLATILRTAGHTVFAAADGVDALRLVREARPDLVISDILMPTVDGYEFVRQLRRMPDVSATPVIFYTATYYESEARHLATQCGVLEILTKPCHPDRLLATVAAIVADGRQSLPAEPDPWAFQDEHLQVVSSSLATKVEQFEASEQRMAAIVQLAQQLTAERDPEALLKNVCAVAREVTMAQQAIIGMLADDGVRTDRVITSGVPPSTDALFEAPAIADSMVSSVVRTRSPLRLAMPESRQAGSPADRPAAPLLSALVVPISSPSRVHGWLALRNKLGTTGFSEADERVAVTLAAHAGIAYENARLYGDLRQRTRALELEVKDRARAEQALRESDERTRFALAAARMATWEVDLVAGALTYSDTLPTLYGFDRDRAPEMSASPDALETLVHPDDRLIFTDARERARTERRDFAIEFRVVWPDRSIHWLGSRARYDYDPDGTPVRLIGVVMDLDERKRLEDQVRLSQKMEAIGQLAGGVAHDFNNLLTAILGYGNLAAEGLADDDPRAQDLAEIIRAGERASGLTRQLLAFSRKQVLQPRVLDLGDLVNETSRLLRRLIGEDIWLDVRLDPDPLPVRADPGQLEQVLMNLAINARDAMPTGGHLTVEASQAEIIVPQTLSHGDLRPGRYVLLHVSDTGVGMDNDTRQRLFEPFFTTKEHGKGTGLGLATVHTIVEQAGGIVGVASEPGRGAAFSVYLPWAPEQLEDARPVRAKRGTTGTETILVVEDEESVRVLTRVVLERAGYIVLEATGPEQAELICAEHGDEIALVLTDVIMPGGTGPALYERLVLKWPLLKVLFMSGYTGDTLTAQTRLLSEVPFLNKPFTADRLSEKVREVLDA